jgi:GNAT superfamily N-acetyltransferase
MIRRGIASDVEPIVQMGVRVHAKSPERAIKVDLVHCRTLVLGMMLSGDGVVLVSVDATGRLNGFMLGLTEPIFYNPRRKYATDLMTAGKWSTKSALLKAFVQWAKDKKVARILMGESMGYKRDSKMYERAGFQRVGGMYDLQLSKHDDPPPIDFDKATQDALESFAKLNGE